MLYTNQETEQMLKFAKSLKKSLSIKYTSCSKDDKFIYLRFEVSTKNLNEDKAEVYVDELDSFINDTAVPRTQIVISKNKNVGITLKFDKDKDFTETFYDDGNVFQATITCDGLSAKSEKFKLNFKKDFTKNLNSEGYYYNLDGTFIKKIGNSDDVYIENGEKLQVDNINLLRIAGLAFAESGYSEDIIKSIPYCVINRHKIYFEYNKSIRNNKNYGIYDTLYKMRNRWDDYTYAHEHHYGANGNPAFRDFLGIMLNDSIDFDKNAMGRNENKLMKLAIEYSIKALSFQRSNYKQEDFSNGGLGWQGMDIITGTGSAAKYWRNNLFVHIEHKKFGFSNWVNIKSLDNSISETTMIGKGTFGSTVIWKQTKYAWKQDPIKALL